MPKITVIYGLALVLIGFLAYFVIGEGRSFTAFIPSIAGGLFVALGLLAMKESLLKHAMHTAVLLALVFFLATVRGLTQLPALLAGEEVARPLAVQVQSASAVLSAIFIILAVIDFIRIRKARKAAA
ncbi:MAG: hypothetical protein EA369_10030 [Bradymonadales bacterium]|nr:MAG: hypothetical protein EA369_10030 [Bradymonadales bacterium]